MVKIQREERKPVRNWVWFSEIVMLTSMITSSVICSVLADGRPSKGRLSSRLGGLSTVESERSWGSVVKLRAQSATAGGDHTLIGSNTTRLRHEEEVKEKVKKLAALATRQRRSGWNVKNASASATSGVNSWDLDEAYDKCLDLMSIDWSSVVLNTSSDQYPFLHLGLSSILRTTMLLWKSERQKALAAYLVWCRRTDELVDGINGSLATPEVLNKWEERLVDIFEGRPHDIYDAALHDAVSKYSLDIQLLKDLIEGMRMDMRKTRYDSFDELNLHAYHVAGTVAIGIVQILGVSPDSKAPAERIYTSAVSFALTLQLTDILRDISEDARRGRFYLPLDEIANAGISEDHIFDGGVMMTQELRNYVKAQIKRARMYADEGDLFIKEMSSSDQTILWMFSLMNRRMLDRIEDNGYDLTKPTPMGLTDVSETLLGSLVKSHI